MVAISGHFNLMAGAPIGDEWESESQYILQ